MYKLLFLILLSGIINSEKTIMTFKSHACESLAYEYQATVFGNAQNVIFLEHLGIMIVDIETHAMINAMDDIHEFHECVDKVFQDEVITKNDPVEDRTQANFNYISWNLRRINVRDLPMPSTFTRQEPPAGKHAHVYIIDSGIDQVNPDLSDKLAPLEQHQSYIQNDACCTNQFDALCDCYSHGTHCAGIVASPIAGYNIKAILHSMKIFNSKGSTTYSILLQAMDKVISNKKVYHPDQLTIASMSLAGPKYSVFNNAADKMVDNGIFLVVAAGNNDADACNYSPASSTKAFTVGATDIDDSRAYFSNYGECVDIFAPGVYIYSTKPGSGYKYMSGTSMATPFIAGYASYIGLILNTTDPQLIKDEINRRATKGIVTDALSSANNLPYDGSVATELDVLFQEQLKFLSEKE
jgi:subtilisin family serine protease